MSSPGTLPPLMTRQTDTPAPLEGQDVPETTGLKNTYGAALYGTLGSSLLAHIGSGGPDVSHDEAVKTMKENGYDPAVLPDGNISSGYLGAVMGQQGEIQRDREMASRAHLGGVAQWTASFAGQMSDPLFLALGPLGKAAQGVRAVAGIAEAAEGATLAVRAAKGSAEAAGVIGAYETGQKFIGTGQGDRDITTGQIVHDAAFAGLIGGVAGAAFGKRPVPPRDVDAHLDMVRYAENTDAYAKAHGIPANEVVSPTGAIGEYQVEPSTAKQYGFDPAKLKDPDYNRTVAQAIIRDLDKRFNGDPELVAIGYNAGPGRARQFLRSGRDRSTLPAETQAYLARIDARDGSIASPTVTPEAQEAIAKTAVLQASNDSVVNVDPLIKDATKQADEPTPDLSPAVPKSGSILTQSDAADAISARIEEQPKAASPELEQLSKSAQDAIGEAEHAHTMANGVPQEGEVVPQSELHTALAEDDEAIKGDADLHKAIEAAVQCSIVRGTE